MGIGGAIAFGLADLLQLAAVAADAPLFVAPVTVGEEIDVVGVGPPGGLAIRVAVVGNAAQVGAVGGGYDDVLADVAHLQEQPATVGRGVRLPDLARAAQQDRRRAEHFAGDGIERDPLK